MEIIDVIKNNFNKGYFNKAMAIEGLPEEYPAWTIKRNDWYGVAVPADNMPFSEKFASARIWKITATIDGQDMDLLALTCSNVELRNEFALICAQFVQPGENGSQRKKLIVSPAEWWNNWKVLLGNKSLNDDTYPILGELIVVSKLMSLGCHPKWSGIESATHDVELANTNRSYEVKSTSSRYGYEVEISSIYQLKKAGEQLDLVFLRFERSLLGVCINDLVNELVSLGESRTQLEEALEKKGLENGCTAREIKYKLLEMKVFPVDDSFPMLTIESFVGSTLPAHIKKVKYVVDLAGVEGKAEII